MGTSFFDRLNETVSSNHPHAYGDKFLKQNLTPQVLGSSPRVWGQGIPKIKDLIPTRIIPTRMGTSLTELTEKELQ